MRLQAEETFCILAGIHYKLKLNLSKKEPLHEPNCSISFKQKKRNQREEEKQVSRSQGRAKHPSKAANVPAAIRAALAKFPVSMQAINSLLSSTVFLRTRAGFPLPHFGRLRVVLGGGGRHGRELAFRTKQ